MSPPTTAEAHRTGSYYGAFAYAVVILTCYATFFTTRQFFASEWMVPVVFGLGAIYAALGVLGGSILFCRARLMYAVYYLLQCGLLTLVVFLSPVRGFLGILVLPVVSQAIFDLRAREAVLVGAYLFAINIAVWAIPYGWDSGLQAVVNYSAAFAFTIVFTIITKQALNAREREETLRHEVEASHEKLRIYAAQAEDLATTRERNRVAREIHDGVGHYLTVVKTQLDAAAAILPTQPDRALAAITQAAKLTSDALDDVRRSVGALRTDTGRPPLPEALRELAAHGEPVPTLTVEGSPRPLPPGVEHALYRAAQEGLTNIRKHARATSALMRLDFRTPQRVVLELADNGVGATPAAGETGFGLRGLRERIALLGGTVDTGNRLEGGFALRVEVPA
ncbi:MAG: sensor histidine kinase [Lacunisphaera sp.]|nr:sensor histidine kinase [Lacunisphaera sp.]